MQQRQHILFFFASVHESAVVSHRPVPLDEDAVLCERELAAVPKGFIRGAAREKGAWIGCQFCDVCRKQERREKTTTHQRRFRERLGSHATRGRAEGETAATGKAPESRERGKNAGHGFCCRGVCAGELSQGLRLLAAP